MYPVATTEAAAEVTGSTSTSAVKLESHKQNTTRTLRVWAALQVAQSTRHASRQTTWHERDDSPYSLLEGMPDWAEEMGQSRASDQAAPLVRRCLATQQAVATQQALPGTGKPHLPSEHTRRG